MLKRAPLRESTLLWSNLVNRVVLLDTGIIGLITNPKRRVSSSHRINNRQLWTVWEPVGSSSKTIILGLLLLIYFLSGWEGRRNQENLVNSLSGSGSPLKSSPPQATAINLDHNLSNIG